MFNELAKQIHEGNAARGFWEGERKLTEVVMLTVCELSEAIEADRAGKWCTEHDIIKYLNRPETFKETIKDTVQDEIADAKIRLLDFSHKFGIDIDSDIKVYDNYFKNVEYSSDESFINNITDIVHTLMNSFDNDSRDGIFKLENENDYNCFVAISIVKLYKISKLYNIDLDFHVKAKLSYNASRPYKHGKSY